MLLAFWATWVGQSVTMELSETIGAGAVPQAWNASVVANHAIESRCCSTVGMDAHARTTTVKGVDRSTGVTATKRFDDVPAPSAIASWMQSKFTGPWHAAYEPIAPRAHRLGDADK